MTVTTNTSRGPPIQTISFARIRNAGPLKNAEMLNGDVAIGRHGEKYRSLSKGMKNPTPSPASVNASSTPCDIVARKANIKMVHQVRENRVTVRKNKGGMSEAVISANKMEWVKPRCPRGCAYSIPSEKVMTSRSGKIGRTARIVASRQREISVGPSRLSEVPTMA